MKEPSLFRLYLLRSVYLIIAVGLGVEVWPELVQPIKHWSLMEGVVDCMLAALGALALLGLRYPLKMLPLLVWEMLWKSIWLGVVALPLWLAGQMDKATWATTFACMMGVIVPIAMPWKYLFAQFARWPGDRWH
jgi:hypothetical protein